MSTDTNVELMQERIGQLRSRQKPLIAGTRHRPFLTDPADFLSSRTAAELDASQAGQLIKAPPPKRTPAVMDIAEVIGAQQAGQIAQSGRIVFHAAGDTGSGAHTDLAQVVQIMAMDYQRPNSADHPAFFFHLGDVIYNDVFGQAESKANMYLPQFYTPYGDYPGKIVAVPGNHDSNPQEDPQSIDAFEANFCAPPPQTEQDLQAVLESPNRGPMYQPGVYYRLDAPFVQILALFSNGGEHEGVISGATVGGDQLAFLVAQLAEIWAARDQGQRKALLVAVHHPPFSGGGGHTGSAQMLRDLDAAFAQGGVAPDAVISGHAHNYQRFTREITFNGAAMEVPYVVAGNGGHNITPMKPGPDRRPVSTPLAGGTPAGGASDHSLRQYFNGFGHLVITVTGRALRIDLIGTKTQTERPVDSVTVDLGSGKITDETLPFSHPANGEQQTSHGTSLP